VFSVWSERAEESWQWERLEVVRRMGQIFVAILAGVCSTEGAAMAMERFENLSDEVTEGRSNVRVEERGGWIVNS